MHALRAAALVALATFALALAGAVAADAARDYQTSDFFCLWSAGRLVARGVDPYDEARWREATGGLYPAPDGTLAPAPCPGRFGYPLWTAVSLAPLGAAPLHVAASIWMAVSFGAVALGAALLWRAVRGPASLAALFALLVLFAQPFWLLAISGQLSGLLLGLVGVLAWALARGRGRAAGASLAALALKPQLVAVFVPVTLARAIARRDTRLVVAALVVGAVALGVTEALRPAWPLEWLGEITVRRLRVAALLPTAWGFAGDAFGATWIGAVLVALLVVALVLLVRGVALDDVSFAALALPVSLFAAPYAWSYDWLVLALPWAALLALAGRARGKRRPLLLVATVVVASTLPWLLYWAAFSRGGETLSAVVPALTAILLASALRADASAA